MSRHTNVKELGKAVMVLGQGAQGKVCLHEVLPPLCVRPILHHRFRKMPLDRFVVKEVIFPAGDEWSQVLAREEAMRGAETEIATREALNCSAYNVKVLGGRVDKHKAVIIMEQHGTGKTAADYLRVPRSNADKSVMLERLAHGLNDAHIKGICHLDVKPQNLLMKDDQPSTSKLGDFGVGRLTGAVLREIVGTPLFVPPEIIRVNPKAKPLPRTWVAHPSADWWSYGFTAFVLYALSEPMDSDTSYDLLRRANIHS